MSLTSPHSRLITTTPTTFSLDEGWMQLSYGCNIYFIDEEDEQAIYKGYILNINGNLLDKLYCSVFDILRPLHFTRKTENKGIYTGIWHMLILDLRVVTNSR